jgi:hypothetical protein
MKMPMLNTLIMSFMASPTEHGSSLLQDWKAWANSAPKLAFTWGFKTQNSANNNAYSSKKVRVFSIYIH